MLIPVKEASTFVGIQIRYTLGVWCILICNNQGLLTQIEEVTQWSYATPNITLRVEWDIQLVILATYKELTINFSFTHVKSHQDNGTPVSGLSLETCLNMEAGQLATEFLQANEAR
jgi:hypothetical protein